MGEHPTTCKCGGRGHLPVPCPDNKPGCLVYHAEECDGKPFARPRDILAELDALKIELAVLARKLEAPYPVWDVIHADYAKRDAALEALQADVRTLSQAVMLHMAGQSTPASFDAVTRIATPRENTP